MTSFAAGLQAAAELAESKERAEAFALLLDDALARQSVSDLKLFVQKSASFSTLTILSVVCQ